MTPYPVYPLGVAHLLGALTAAGHEARHYDVMANGGLERLAGVLADFDPDLIGLSIRNLDTVDSTAPDAFMEPVRETMTYIRARHSAPVVLGGPAFSIMPETVLAFLGADYGVVGEGENLLPWLAGEIGAGRRPSPRILTGQTDPCPWRPVVYDQATVDFYLSWGGMLNVQTKRGCPYRCAYCSYPALEGRTYRFREPGEVAEEVIRAGREHGGKYIFFTDSVFNDVRGHYLEVAEALIRAGNTVPWCAFFRPQNLNAENLSLLKRSGLSAMEVGADASSDETLAAMRKDFNFAEVIATNELAVAAGVPCAHFIILGGPGENRQTLTRGLANIEQLSNSVVFAFTGIRVLPGTAMHQRAIADGVMFAGQSLLEPFFYFSPELAEAELDATLKEAWRGRFDRIYPSSVMQERITHLHRKGHVGPMWDMLVRRRR
jgi:lipid biosynthesis B12-binding/radical SAM protein